MLSGCARRVLAGAVLGFGQSDGMPDSGSQVGVIYRHWLTEDVATAYIAGLFHLLLGKITTSPSAKEPVPAPLATAKPPGDGGTGPEAKAAEQPSEADEVSMFGNDLIRSCKQPK